MRALQPNPVTGFLESPSATHRKFDSDKKVKVIELVKQAAESKTWPRVSDICKQVDIGSETFYAHLDQDPEFSKAYEEAMSPVEDQLASNLFKQGLNANGITANIFLLKTRWRKRWGENNQIISVDFGALKSVFEKVNSSIDAEIIAEQRLINTQSKQVDKSTNDSDVKT